MGLNAKTNINKLGFYQKKRSQNNLTLVWQIEAKQNKYGKVLQITFINQTEQNHLLKVQR